MRWTHKDERCVKRFAFLPYENEEEVRWLETVYIWQSYNPWGLFSSWKNQRFATKEEYLNWKKGEKIMTYKEFKKWCYDRSCDGCWSSSVALFCRDVMANIDIYFWKRKREAEWQKISDKIINSVVKPLDETRNRMLSTKKCDICAHTYEPYGANKDDKKPYCDHVIFIAKDKPMDTLELCPNCMERLCHTILEWGEGEPNG